MTPAEDDVIELDATISIAEDELATAQMPEVGPDAAADVDATACETIAPGFGETTEERLPDELEELRFGRLVAVRELAVGGMGRIYEAWDPRLRRNVVVKVLRPFPKLEAMNRARLLREARVTAQLQHAGIVPVHDIGETDAGELYYVMQKIEGCTLRDVLSGLRRRDPEITERWTLFSLLSVFERVCSAVAYAHDRGVIHRDIKPSNIMLGPFDEVLIVAWGVVRLGDHPDVNAEASMQVPIGPDGEPMTDEDPWGETGPGLTVGTPGYMAPEQVTGDRPNIGAWSDVFSLGVVLYEILVGNQPFSGKSPVAVLVSSLRDDVAEPADASAWGEIPRELSDLCTKAMAYDHEDRYADAAFLARAMHEFLDASQREESASPFLADGVDALRRLEANRQVRDAAAEELDQLEAAVASWAAPPDRERLWTARRRVDELRCEADALRAVVEAAAERALEKDPENSQARALLGLAKSEDGRRPADQEAPAEGTGTVSLFTEPARARIVAERVERSGLVWRPVERRALGSGPLTMHELPVGSWLLTVTAPRRVPVVYPVVVEAGEHWDSGSEPVALPWEDELPPRTVHVPSTPEGGAFRIGQVPVTNAEYLEFLRSLAPGEAARRVPRRPDGRPLWPAITEIEVRDAAGRPFIPLAAVTGISWHDAEAYAAWRSDKDGVAWRLPTGDEWDRACQGVDGRRFPWGDEPDPSLCKTAFSRRGPPEPEPVGTFATDRSVYGVREVAGGCAEWCAAEGPETGRRPIRGTAWFESLDRAAAGRERDAAASDTDPGIGFRLACDAPVVDSLPTPPDLSRD